MSSSMDIIQIPICHYYYFNFSTDLNILVGVVVTDTNAKSKNIWSKQTQITPNGDIQL